MKTKLTLTLFLFLICSQLNAQTVDFLYDAAGNQIKRSYCTGCSRVSNTVKDYKKLTDSDMDKFFPDDVISYYPNPVKDELFLKWDLINDNKVTSIDIININGQTVKNFNNIEENTFVNLNYSSGEHKSITIIKN